MKIRLDFKHLSPSEVLGRGLEGGPSALIYMVIASILRFSGTLEMELILICYLHWLSPREEGLEVDSVCVFVCGGEWGGIFTVQCCILLPFHIFLIIKKVEHLEGSKFNTSSSGASEMFS